MAEAEVGDDVFGEDPTVNHLQEKVAAILGKEAALFVPSGTMSNQIAVRCQTQPGDEIICEAASHILHFELVGIAALSGVHARPVPGKNGMITAGQILAAIRPDIYYLPRTKLIALENTHNMAGGTIWPLEEISKVRELATEKRLRLHLDGARLWNACVASGIAAAEYGRAFDSISVCFSKGLGAPAGSAIAGSRELIAEARRCRKLFGGGMRQVGILAAAAIYALENHLDRLAEDHANARKLAENLNELDGLSVELTSVQTNIVVIDLSRSKLDSVAAVERLKREGVLVVPFGPHTLRAVTHLEITTNDIDRAVTAFQKVFG